MEMDTEKAGNGYGGGANLNVDTSFQEYINYMYNKFQYKLLASCILKSRLKTNFETFLIFFWK